MEINYKTSKEIIPICICIKYKNTTLLHAKYTGIHM